jgi:hypothetical protein
VNSLGRIACLGEGPPYFAVVDPKSKNVRERIKSDCDETLNILHRVSCFVVE